MTGAGSGDYGETLITRTIVGEALFCIAFTISPYLSLRPRNGNMEREMEQQQSPHCDAYSGQEITSVIVNRQRIKHLYRLKLFLFRRGLSVSGLQSQHANKYTELGADERCRFRTVIENRSLWKYLRVPLALFPETLQSQGVNNKKQPLHKVAPLALSQRHLYNTSTTLVVGSLPNDRFLGTAVAFPDGS